MRYSLFLAACLCTPCVAQELPQTIPEVQAQFKKTYETINRLGVVSYDNVEVFQAAQEVKQLVDDDDEVVRQLAIFVATTESSENTHVIIAWTIWRYFNVSPDAMTRVLAPYLDASNVPLREFARDWFLDQDEYKDFKKYVRWLVSRDEEIPAPFIKLLFERSPGQALRVLQSGSVDVRAHVEVVRTRVEARQQGRELTLEERKEIHEVEEESERKGREGREILLAEHFVSNALWLEKNAFNEQLQAALPEAMAALEKLASHEKWWARLYVAHIMRRNPVLLQDHILRKLAEDEHTLVREAAKRRAARPAPKPSKGLVAPKEAEARAVSPTSIEVKWQASAGATSYVVQRRRPDIETEFTTIASGVTGTSYTDSGLVRHTLYEYRVAAEQNP